MANRIAEAEQQVLNIRIPFDAKSYIKVQCSAGYFQTIESFSRRAGAEVKVVRDGRHQSCTCPICGRIFAFSS